MVASARISTAVLAAALSVGACQGQAAGGDGDGETVVLGSDTVEVTVAAGEPRILSYRLKATGGRIEGSMGAGLPSVVISRRGGQRQTVAWKDLASKAVRTPDAIVFACTARLGGAPAAAFDYAIRLKDHTVTIAMENIREEPGFDLNDFLPPPDPLIRATSATPGGRICVGDLVGEHWRGGQPAENGRIARPGEALAGDYHFGMVFGEKVAAGLWSNCLHDRGGKPVRTAVGDGWTGLYTGPHRYSFLDENYEPYICRIGIVGDVSGDGAIDWKDAACFIHQAIPKRVNLRQDCMKYMLDHGVDFDSAADSVLRKACNISDGHKQMALLSGWNGWGWDSEYPTWNQPGEEYGGREGLYRLHREAHGHRAYTSMIHNFDDAYQKTRMWDESIISRNDDGSLVRATWWAGGPSFIISPYRFWKTGRARETVDGLLAQGLEGQIFSDVFTILPYRRDAGPGGAGDELTNLVLGKFRLLDYLARHDVYMNSEGFNYEMLGRYIGGHNGYNVRFERDPDRPPVAWFICHGLLAKKFWRADSDEGRFRGEDTEIETPFKVGQVYRWAMLLSFYGDKPVRDFRPVEGGFLARYGDDVEVVWNVSKKPGGVTVKLRGQMIADGGTVLLPKPERGKDMWNVLRAFTAADQPMRYPRPKHWTDIGQLTVMALTYENPPAPVPNEGLVAFDGQDLLIRIPPDRPYKLVYGRHLVEGEKNFEPLPPRRELSYPLDEVISREGGEARPAWVRLKTRRGLTWPADVTPCVGCSAVWPSRQQATQHAADIVAKKIAWFTRQNYVFRSRDYEKACGQNAASLGYDNWNLGYEAAVKLYTLEAINARKDTQWYWEQVRAGPDRATGWKAFVCVPFTPKDGQHVYLQAARDRLDECRAALRRGPPDRRRAQLEANVKVYELLLKDEPAKPPRPVKFQV